MLVIAAPSNLGLAPPRPNREPGTWRAPQALFAAGLLDVLGAPPVVALPRPPYSPHPEPGTRLRNGHAMRQFNLLLADAVHEASKRTGFVLVVGGDCSILPGALAGARRSGPLFLVHVDGHSDFRHPGNTAPARDPDAAAGMDLAMVTGRGEALGTAWPGVDGPLVADTDIVQLGDRENRNQDFPWFDLRNTTIERIDVFDALHLGPAGVAARIAAVLGRDPDRGLWVHLDVDVLDRTVMPAVDCPGSPGLLPDDLVAILAPLVTDRRCRGLTLTIFDPDLDPDGRHAATLVSLVARLRFPRDRTPPPPGDR